MHPARTAKSCKYDAATGMIYVTATSLYFSGKVFSKKLKVGGASAPVRALGARLTCRWDPARRPASSQFALLLRDVRSVDKRKNGLIANAISVSTDVASVRGPALRGPRSERAWAATLTLLATSSARLQRSRRRADAFQYKFIDFRHRDAVFDVLTSVWRRVAVRPHGVRQGGGGGCRA